MQRRDIQGMQFHVTWHAVLFRDSSPVPDLTHPEPLKSLCVCLFITLADIIVPKLRHQSAWRNNLQVVLQQDLLSQSISTHGIQF